VVLAAWLRRIPVVLYLPDVEPGLAVRFLSRFATRIAVTTAKSKTHFPRSAASRVVETGYPVRPEVAGASRVDGRGVLGLPAQGFVLLVFGGSRGALTLNEAAFSGVGDLLGSHTDLHVVHVCGRDDETRATRQRDALPAEQAARYHPYGYLHSSRMAAALASADLIVSRSGASVMGEFPCVGAPSVLVPYPHAGAHQTLNAEYLSDAGAAVIIDNESIRQGALPGIVGELIRDGDRLATMSVAARSLAKTDAASAIARLLVECAGVGRETRRAANYRGD
jgi:UDP-N-acetylglucosamine--N-acetylmuramyl-(pentapeptide) pyrophosphoryl-undecaprenol N-acetylglucosamine transferase